MSFLMGERRGDEIVLFAGGYDVEGIAAQLKTLTPLLKPTEPKGGLRCPLTWSAMTQLAHTYGPAWRPGPQLQAWLADEVRRRTAASSWAQAGVDDAPAGLVPPVVDGVQWAPRHYQLDGGRMISAVGRAFLFDDPGTGKTLTTIIGILHLIETGRLHPGEPIVIICPNSVQDGWVREFERWTSLRVVAWRGTMARRRRLAHTADVYVAAYSTARTDGDRQQGPDRRALWDMNPAMVVADECHALKNRNSVQSRVVRSLGARARFAVLLSGTPITHTVRDLWPSLATIEPLAFPSEERYRERYVLSVPGDYDDEVIGLHPHREPEFRLGLTGQYRRLAKADVLTELPPKIYSVREVDLPPAYRKAYDQLEADMLAELPDGGELPVFTALALMTRLSQLASAAADVWTTTELKSVEDPVTGERVEQEVEVTHVKLKAPSWKADALLEILEEHPGRQVAVFSPSRQLLEVAGEIVAKAGYRIGYVVGGQTAAQRTADIDAFQRGDLDVIMVSTRAGGVGITLTAASVEVFLQRPWSFVEASQAEDRCHRIGSEIHDAVEIIDVVAKDTVESRVREVLRKKAGALSELLEDPRIQREVLGGLT